MTFAIPGAGAIASAGPARGLEEENCGFSLTEEPTRHPGDRPRVRARREVDPIVEEIDESQEYPREVMAKAAELGFLGIIFPEEMGGAGLGYVEYVIVVTELSKVDPSVGISVAAHNSLCTNHIYKFGNDEQRKRWVVPLARGEKDRRLSRPSGGRLGRRGHRSRAERWTAVGAERLEDLHHHGKVGASASSSRSPTPTPGHQNISAFVLDKGMPGFRAGKKENSWASAPRTPEVIMEDCFVSEDRLLGDVGQGFTSPQILDGGASRSPPWVSAPDRRYETALKYSRSASSSASRSRASGDPVALARWRPASPPARS